AIRLHLGPELVQAMGAGIFYSGLVDELWRPERVNPESNAMPSKNRQKPLQSFSISVREVSHVANNESVLPPQTTAQVQRPWNGSPTAIRIKNLSLDSIT